MVPHFLLTAKAHMLTIATVLRMTDVDAEQTFAALRWPETDGAPVCPFCGCPICYPCRRPSGALRSRCKACLKDFSLTSGTLFAHYKLRGAMATEMRGARLGGKGTTVEVDGGYFGGYAKPANHKENRRDRRLAKNQNGKRQCLVVIRQRDGRTLPAAFPFEAAALNHIRDRVAHETEIHAGDANSWKELHARYVVKRINHQLAYSMNDTCMNGADSLFSRMRRGEIGHHHHIAGTYLARYAQKSAWEEDHRRDDNGKQVRTVVGLAMKAKSSVDFCGYWQRSAH